MSIENEYSGHFGHELLMSVNREDSRSRVSIRRADCKLSLSLPLTSSILLLVFSVSFADDQVGQEVSME